MRPRTIQTLFNYWESVRAGRIAPRRLEIEPSRIAGILAEVFMLERIDASRYCYRLAGTRLCELLGSELRGSDFLDGWSTDDRLLLERQLEAVTGEGAAVHLAIEATINSRHHLGLEAVLLPLLHGNGIGRIIGAMCPVSEPHWLDKGRLSGLHLLRYELVRPHRRPRQAAPAADRQAPFLPALGSPRVVSSNQRRFRVLDGGLAGHKPGKG